MTTGSLKVAGFTAAGLITAISLMAPIDAQRETNNTRQAAAPFTVVEASIADMRTAMDQKRVTSRQIVTEYLTRIAIYEDKLHAALTVNPRALTEADERDRERAAGRVRGPLHGIPIALKDNIHTTDMPTTGGALAFDGFVPPYEATLTTNLRNAGAIIIAKTGMTELANWVAVGMPGNYNAIGGYGMNPYDPRRDPRPGTGDGRPVMGTGGSSSGIGTTANLWAANVGTETSGSILTPAASTMLAAVKPTVGRVSRYGVIPITADQDTAGPMTKTVRDAAILLGVLEGPSPDSHDAATTRCAPPPNRDYTRYLTTDALRGARIGIPRASYPGNFTGQPGTVMSEAISALTRLGAVVVDPAEIPSVVTTDSANSFREWGTCSTGAQRRGSDEGCSIVLKYGMKRDFNAWLATLGPAAPVKTLAELIAWNSAHKDAGAIKYGQTLLEISDEMDVERDRARYERDRARDLELSATHGIDEAIKTNRLDAILFYGSSGSAIAAKAGYPSVIIPMGFVNNAPASLPPGFNLKPQPAAVTFTGLACTEPQLLGYAYALEQATKKRKAPVLNPGNSISASFRTDLRQQRIFLLLR
ncbi:MAG TPA: amidase family protein [Vicinamibacterales bacterium]|nr:amidase family protein [Vicinamibacterales bacterium]